VIEELERMARVLGSYDIGLLEGVDGPQGDVFEVADGCGYYV